MGLGAELFGEGPVVEYGVYEGVVVLEVELVGLLVCES